MSSAQPSPVETTSEHDFPSQYAVEKKAPVAKKPQKKQKNLKLAFAHIISIVILGAITALLWAFDQNSWNYCQPKKITDPFMYCDLVFIATFVLCSWACFVVIHWALHFLGYFLLNISRSFVKSASRQFRSRQWFLLSPSIRSFVWSIVVLTLATAFFPIDATNEDKRHSEVVLDKLDWTQILRLNECFEKFLYSIGLRPNFFHSRFLTGVSERLVILFAVLLIQKVFSTMLYIRFHMSHYRDKMENNDFLVNIFEVLKKKYRRSKKHSSVAIAPSPMTTAHGSIGAIPTSVSDMKSMKNHIFSTANEKLRAQEYARGVYEMLTESKRGEYLVQDDFSGYISTADASKFFPLLTLDHSKNLTLPEFEMAIVNIYQEKENLLKSVVDHTNILDEVDTILRIVFLSIWVILTLEQLMILLVAIALILKWLFEPTLKVVLQSTIFVIWTHTFDVGDCISVDGNRFCVSQIHLMVTVLQNLQGATMYFNNSTLSQKQIVNIRRSCNQKETLVFYIHTRNDPAQVEAVREGMAQFLLRNPRDYEPKLTFFGYNVYHEGKMEIRIQAVFRGNFQDLELYRKRRTALMQECIRQLTEHGVQLTPPVVRSAALQQPPID